MSSVDDRIVNMQFNNKQFVANAAASEKSLTSLEGAIANTAKSKGMGALASTVDTVKSKFSALQVAGVTAVATIANKAVNAGISLVKSFTIDPVKAGLESYNQQINATQVILANTKAAGVKLSDVTATLKDLQNYANLTVYSFSEMTENIGRFTAAGVPLKAAQSAIKGMANVAALSGANTQQMSSAMYQMSQALSAGVLRLQDWNSLSNANMAGTNIQKAIEATAHSMKDSGKPMDEALAKFGNFRQSLQSGWLTADIYSKSMKVFGGTINKSTGKMKAFSVEQIKQMGYSEADAKSLHTLSKDALNSATKIRTLPQLMQALKEEVATQWGQIFKAIFGNINQATTLFSKVHNVLENALTNPLKDFAKLLQTWSDMGGRAAVLQGMGNIFKDLAKVAGVLKDAFKEIFPPASADTLVQMSKNFEAFTEMLTPSKATLVDLKNIFAGLFAILHIGLTISAAFRALFIGLLEGIFKGSGPASHGILDMFSSLGKFLVQADKFITQGGKLVDVFRTIGQIAGGMVAQGLTIASNIIAGIVQGLNPAPLEKAITDLAHNIVTWIEDALGIHSPAEELVPVGENIILGIIKGWITAIPLIIQGVGEVVKAIMDSFANLLSGTNSTEIASMFNVLLTGGLLLMGRKVLKFIDTWRGWGNNMQGIFDGVQESMESWQKSLRAKMILEIAIAIGILAAAIIALSFVKPEKLAVGLGAITALLASLSHTLTTLMAIESKEGGNKTLATLAASLLLISAAMIGFAIAITILAHQKPEKVAAGLGFMGATLGLLIGTMFAFSKIGAGEFVAMSGSLILIAIAINLLVAAITALGLLPIKVVAQGLIVIGLALILLTDAMLTLDGMKEAIGGGAAALLAVSTALVILSVAIAAFGNMDWGTLAKGFGAVTVALILFTESLLILAEEGPSVLAAAGAMVLMATAMAMLVPVIVALGSMDTGTLVKGILALAAVVLIMSLAIVALGTAAEEVAPGLLILGASLALIGLGMLAFGTGFALLAATGAAGTAVLITTIHAVLALLPEIALQLASAFVGFLKVIANATGPIREAMNKIMTNILGIISDAIPKIVKVAVQFVSQLIKGITKLIPQFGKLISAMIKAGLNIITQAIPQYINAGETIIIKILQGLSKNLPKLVNAAGDLIVRFVQALGKQANRVVDAAGHTILSFLQGIDKAVNKYEPQIIHEGLVIAGDIVKGLVSGLTGAGALSAIGNAASGLAHHALDAIKHPFGIGGPSKAMCEIGKAAGAGLANGIDSSAKLAVAAAVRMANAVISEGNRIVLASQRMASQQEAAAAAAKKRAQIAEQEAKDAEKHANQVAKRKGSTKAEKQAANAESARAKKHANELTKIANQAQKKSDRAAQHVQDVQTFQQADDTGKGDILSTQSEDLASKANKKLAEANAEAAEAKKLMKTNRKAGLALLKQSRADAKAAEDLAKRAKKANADADKYYTRAVNARIKQLASDAKARADQDAFDKADAAGQQKILNDRAAAEQKRADNARKKADDLIARAKKLAKTGSAADAKEAAHLLDLADAQVQIANDQADAAKQDKQQAADLASQAAQSASSGTSTGTGTTLTPSPSVLQDAASQVDRYTASLAEAEALAVATTPSMQFVQNNTSPVALTPSEVYRQTKNLLSLQQTKMGAPGAPMP